MIPKEIRIEDISAYFPGTLIERLGIELTAVGDDFLSGKMPVDTRTFQPNRILHGGAVSAFAESLASLASSCIINREKQETVGLEINVNHIRRVSSGYVHATARAIHIGRRTHVWDIRVTDDFDQLTSVGRLTVAVIEK